MLVALPKEKYELLFGIKEFDLFPLIASVIHQKQQGEIFVDANNDLKTVYVIHRSGFSYLYSTSEFKDYKKLLSFFNEEKKVPAYFHIYDPPGDLLKCLDQFPQVGYRIRERIQLIYDKHAKPALTPKIDGNLHAAEITIDNIDEIKKLNNKLFSSFWRSDADFLENGYGVALFDGNDPVSICYSACIGNNRAEIDVLTKKGYENRGLGSYVTWQFIKKSIERNIIPNWDCFKENTGSLNIALKTGFSTVKEYNFLSLYFKDKVDENK